MEDVLKVASLAASREEISAAPGDTGRDPSPRLTVGPSLEPLALDGSDPEGIECQFKGLQGPCNFGTEKS